MTLQTYLLTWYAVFGIFMLGWYIMFTREILQQAAIGVARASVMDLTLLDDFRTFIELFQAERERLQTEPNAGTVTHPQRRASDWPPTIGDALSRRETK